VECVACFKSNEQFDKPLLLKVLKNACEDTATLTILVVVAITIFSDTRQDIIKLLFLPALEKLTSLKATDWVYETWFMKDQVNSIFAKLNSDERHKILSNLLCLERIDYKAEAILIPIANNFPKEVIEFFKQRIDTEKNQDDATNNYESIPFNFHQLGKSLSNHVDIILDSVSNWYNENYELFRFYGANLVSNIFSQYTFLLDFKLRILISNNIENNYNIVMAILHNYKGTLKINDICKYLVLSLPEDSELLDRVFSIFLSTGIVEGDFGLANKWNQTKNELSSWLEDPNLKVKNFAKKYTNILDQQIKQEQGKAEERLELRKRSDD
ncbi:hypothetical protein L3V83_00610, partial [Thiotrichales bacterium 19X7-9]|nr:hypothetical protein [Thiotrichales bacterium 19X7-9]